MLYRSGNGGIEVYITVEYEDSYLQIFDAVQKTEILRANQVNPSLCVNEDV